MPLREYHCPQCDAEFEELVSGDSIPPCPSCGARTAKPLISCCCIHGGEAGEYGATGAFNGSSGGGCAGCSGGSCASCH